MAQSIPKWVMEKYSTLWRKHQDNDFTFSKAMETLKEEDKVIVSMVLSELRKSGWLTIKLNPDDARKRIYTLEIPEDIIKKIEVRA